MKVATLAGAFLSALLLTTEATAGPIISLDPDVDSLTGAGPVSVDINVSGLEESLYGFEIDFLFDSTIFTPGTVTFLGNLGDPTLGEALVDGAITSPGVANVYEITFLFAFELAALQQDAVTGDMLDFTLATVTLDRAAGAGSGETFFSTENIVLTDFDGLAMDGVTNPAASIVLDASVPEPGTMLLMLVAGLGLGNAARRSRKRA